jgi:hypothetical protein
MKAKDIEPGKIYAAQKWSGSVLGVDIIPFLVGRIEKSPKRRGWGGACYGGDTRAFGLVLDPLTLLPGAHTPESNMAIAKVLGPWDAEAYERQRAEDVNRKETDQRDYALATKITLYLSDRGIGSSYSNAGLLIARPTLYRLASLLGIPEEED